MEKLLIAFILMIMLSDINAQTETILLYPKGTPGLKGLQIPEDSKTTEGITLVKDITQPVIFVYKPQLKTSDAAVIICPGGGYGILAIDHEGFEIAQWFNDRGITAFVLKYRLPQDELFDNAEIRPLQDAQQAIRIVRKEASKYGISPEKNRNHGIFGWRAPGIYCFNSFRYTSRRDYKLSSECKTGFFTIDLSCNNFRCGKYPFRYEG